MTYESFHLWKKMVSRASPEGPPPEGPQAAASASKEEDGNPNATADPPYGADHPTPPDEWPEGHEAEVSDSVSHVLRILIGRGSANGGQPM